MKKNFTFILLGLLCIFSTNVSASLSPGDLAVIGMNAGPDGYSTPTIFTDPTRQFAIVALAAIPANEEIFITDRGWINGSPGSFISQNFDGTITFVPSAVIPAGTVMIFKLDFSTASKTISVSKPDGTVVPTTELTTSGWVSTGVSSPWNKDTGDQLLIYQGSATTPTFIFAFNNITTTAINSSNGWSYDPGTTSCSCFLKTSPGYCELPSTLPVGNSIGFFTSRTERFPNVSYSPLASMTSGSKADWLADIVNSSRWTSSSSGDTPQNFASGFGSNSITQFNIGGSTAPVSVYEQLYWPNYEARKIESKSLSGGSRQDVVLNTSATNYGAIGITVDPIGGKVYWFDNDPASVSIKRANLDGTGTEVFVANSGYASSLAINQQNNTLYWPNYEARKIESKSLSGGSRQDVVLNTSATNYGAIGINVDPIGGKVYWFDDNPASVSIKRANLDGTGTEVFVANSGYASSLAINPQNNTLYWPNYEARKIESKSLSGGNRQDVVLNTSATNNGAIGITVDPIGGKVYWFDDTPASVSIMRANLDGTGTEVFVANSGYAYSLVIPFDYSTLPSVAAPTVTALSPTCGPTSGGTSVTITGTNFSGATAVTFGDTAATGFTVNSATQITATAPAGTGTVDVRITTTGGTSATSTSDQFTYVAAPMVTALSPTSGPTSGGTSVTITGTNFSGATAVTFGATAATGFTVNSATQITATAPAGTGTDDVRITTTGGTSATSASDQFTYVAAPTVTALSPTSGPTIGGTSVTITGTNFSGATAVTFGATAATGFTVNSATQITATAPAGTGTVDVRITTTGGTSATTASDQFTYGAAPTVTALSPTSGPIGGGTSVTITGTSFSGATAVTFGATAATGFTVNSATQITATAPAGTGTVDVRITTTGGTSATSASDQFTYTQASQITASAGTFPSALSTTYGTASTSTSVTVSGTGLTAGITATPSSTANFEVSADGTNFGTSAIIGTSGTVYVRLTATAAANTNITGNITLTSTGTNSPVITIPTSTVAQRVITVTAAAKSKTYGDADPALTYTFAPSLVTGDSFSGSLSRLPEENAGTYAINKGTLALSNNYTLTCIGADLTIGAKTITVTAAAKSKTYGDVDPALTYTFAPALVTGDSFSGSLTRLPGENVGTYAINQGTLALSGNYTLTYVGADLTIVAKTITVTAAAKSKIYGDADPALTYTFAPSLVTGDSFSGSLSRLPGENVDTYAINQGTLALSSNYTLTYIGADLTIGAKTITVTAAAKSKTYGDADPALTYTFAPSLVTGDSFSGSLSRSPGENVGTYAINQGILALSGNYTLTYVGADLTIGAKAITVTAAAKSKTYGDADPALTYTFAPSPVTGDSFSGSLSRLPGENAVTYAINQGTLALNSNYTLTYVGAYLTIGAKTITVTAAAKSKTYGDADPALTYTFAPSLVTGDSFSGSLTRLPGENVVTYAINQGTLALSSNYTLTYIGADLTIGAKTITVTAAAKSKTYGDADPALTYTFAPSLVTGDSFSGSLTRLPGENVGMYAINQGTLALSSNYTLTYVGADLTIGAKTITVTAAAKSKTYGDADPALTYTFAPALVTGDSFSGSLARLPGENVGTYSINQGILALSGNYTLTYVGADLTIGAKTITVTAAAKSKTYGDADPALTYTFAPALVTGDSFSGSLARSPGENVGTYAINQGTLALNSNYTLTYVGADLTIGAKTITVTAAAKSKTYGDADPALTYTFAPVLVGTDAFRGSLARLLGENVGTYAINQGTLSAGLNYTITYVDANFSITKADQLITWNQVFDLGCEGETTVVLTATSNSGLPISYTSSNNNSVSVSGNALNLLNYGSVTIAASQLGNNNYNPAPIVALPLVNRQPNLIRKQFEDIIFFDNSSRSFKSYTWYKNGNLVPSQTNQYFRENGPLNGTYYAVATKLDGTLITTCPLILSPTVEEEYIRIAPNPVRGNTDFQLITNVSSSKLQNARIEIFNAIGSLLLTVNTNQNTIDLKAPDVQGIYIVKMTLANGKYFTKNLLVKN